MAMMMLGREPALVSWGLADQEEQVEPDIAVQVVEVPEYVVFEEPEPEPEPERVFYFPVSTKSSRVSMDGRTRRREWMNNVYAAPDEGVHIAWGLLGHEIQRHPTLDELEDAWR